MQENLDRELFAEIGEALVVFPEESFVNELAPRDTGSREGVPAFL